jgi:hypothetical protein
MKQGRLKPKRLETMQMVVAAVEVAEWWIRRGLAHQNEATVSIARTR